MPAPQLIITITPDRTVLVSLRDANGTTGPLWTLPGHLDGRLASFIDTMQALARQKLAPIESSGMGRVTRPDGEPAISHAMDGIRGGQ